MKSRTYAGVAGLAGATLLLEATLTRLLAVAQFYHFAFLVISLALLGFGASGSFLALAPQDQKFAQASWLWRWFTGDRLLTFAGTAFALSVGVATAVVNLLPFDSYAIAWDRSQVIYFILYYLALTLPFLFSGIGIGGALAQGGGQSHLIYAANFLGSSLGALVALGVLWLAGVPGAVLFSGMIGLSVGLFATRSQSMAYRLVVVSLLVIGGAGFLTLSIRNLSDQAVLGISISPYKNLAQARRYPGSETIFSRWNAISRVDVISKAGIRQLPGLSYVFTGPVPSQLGLSIDAADIQPITLVEPVEFEAGDYLPEAIGFALRPNARILILNPGGGLGVLQALAADGGQITAVVGNPLLSEAVIDSTQEKSVYQRTSVRLIHETPRVYLLRDRELYDLIVDPLTDPYRPVTSGAYSLSESFDLTVEAFSGQLARLSPGGILVATRWLQTPPSESVRLVATIQQALEEQGIDWPAQSLVAFRGIQTMTVLVKPAAWSAADLKAIRAFLSSRRYDLVWAPDIDPMEVNRFNQLPSPDYYTAIRGLFEAYDRDAYFTQYPFAIWPAVDDKPFFYHFFTWRQTPDLLATMGKIWQPFGGSGYLILFALLGLVLIFSAVLILAPLLWMRRFPTSPVITKVDTRRETRRKWRVFAFFGLIGLGFLFIEIPLIQRWILYLGFPTYAFTLVVFVLLIFSSLGSALARAKWLSPGIAFGLLILSTLATTWAIPQLSAEILSWTLTTRVLFALFSLAPLGLFMGLPFPMGLSWLENEVYKVSFPSLIPWAWAINGCTSVVASVLAAILALSYGFTAVLTLGTIAYALAWMVFPAELGRG